MDDSAGMDNDAFDADATTRPVSADHDYQNIGNLSKPTSAGIETDQDYQNVGQFSRAQANQVEDGDADEAKVDLEHAQSRDTILFRDGIRKIDYILVYKDYDEKSSDEKMKKKETFENNLMKEGLELEYESKEQSTDGKSYFVKIHAPWNTLTRVAEILALKMPIKVAEIEGQEEEEQEKGCCDSCQGPFEVSRKLVPEEADCFTADFIESGQHMFMIEDKDTFFNHAQRGLVVDELLLRAQYSEERCEFGVDRLIKHGVYTTAFPLHEGAWKREKGNKDPPTNDRQLLYEVWASPKCWYSYQPLDLIRRYFGEKIAIYFTWLGYYTAMLIPAALVGLIAFIYGGATVLMNAPSNEICDVNGAGNFTMCPLCDKYCPWWKLKESCLYSQVTYLFDNPATVFFAAFMAIWATCFLEFWKRKQAELQYDWDVANFETEERIRPEFEIKCKKKKVNPITQQNEPHLPTWSKVPRRITSMAAVLFMICCVIGAVFGVVVYRIIVVAVLYAVDNKHISNYAKLITTITAALLNLIVIILLNKIYEGVAVKLTEMERPKTDTEYEDSITFKMFLFQFINYYSSIFYLAFFKGSFTHRPDGQTFHFLGLYRQEMCDPAGCLIELCIQLAVVMVGKQTINNCKEFLLPKMLSWCRARGRHKNETELNAYTRWEQDNDLEDTPALGLFEEYLEMVIQYGFVTIFVAAFPLAPLFALMNNVVEIRLDAYKFIVTWKRPAAARGQDIGIWYGILMGISFIAVLTNAFIIGWTSDFIPKLVYKYGFSEDMSLGGYVNDSLATFWVQDFTNESMPQNQEVAEFGIVTECRYKAYREHYSSPVKYEYTRIFWNTFAARLAFVIIFEHFVFFLTWLVGYLIPDVPGKVKQLMLREVFLAKEARYKSPFGGDKRKKKKVPTATLR